MKYKAFSSAVLLSFGLLSSTGSALANSPPADRLFLISNKNWSLAGKLKLKSSSTKLAPQTLGVSAEHTLVYLEDTQATQLSNLFHHELNNCGGFIDVTDEFAKSKKDLNTFLADEQKVGPVAFDKAEPTFPSQVAKGLAKFDKTRYWNFLKTLTAFPDRSADSQHGFNAAKWLGDHALKLASDNQRTDVTVRYYETGGRWIQPSTLIKVPGKNSTLPGVLIGAHMDTIIQMGPDKTNNGADDDGSGTATVMETYHAVISSGQKFERDMYFAFYAAEERGLIGSGVMARQFVAEGIKLRGILQFDMTGFRSPKDTAQIYFINDLVDPSMTAFLKKLVVKYVGIPMNQIGDSKCGYACSDHAQWQRNGYAAAFPFESSFQNYNQAIHSIRDKIELLDLEHSSKYAKLGISFVIEAADPTL
jgi:leucyl aminopeptidase